MSATLWTRTPDTPRLKAVLKKIEGWHQGSIALYSISYRDTRGRMPKSEGWQEQTAPIVRFWCDDRTWWAIPLFQLPSWTTTPKSRAS